jgi:hypothetical protein
MPQPDLMQVNIQTSSVRPDRQIPTLAESGALTPPSIQAFAATVEACSRAVENPSNGVTLRGFVSGLIDAARESWQETKVSRD